MHVVSNQAVEEEEALWGSGTKQQKKHITSAWRPACNLTPVASYITCQQILNVTRLLRMVPGSLELYS